MTEWAPIQYRDFWNVPRIFVTSYRGQTILFDCPLDDETEDFPDFYKVYLLPVLAPEVLADSWENLHTQAIATLGQIPISQVHFDSTKRNEIDTALLRDLLIEARMA